MKVNVQRLSQSIQNIKGILNHRKTWFYIKK